MPVAEIEVIIGHLDTANASVSIDSEPIIDIADYTGVPVAERIMVESFRDEMVMVITLRWVPSKNIYDFSCYRIFAPTVRGVVNDNSVSCHTNRS